MPTRCRGRIRSGDCNRPSVRGFLELRRTARRSRRPLRSRSLRPGGGPPCHRRQGARAYKASRFKGHTFNSARTIRGGGRGSMKIAVIGAGEMGHGIAELAALHGHDVRLRDIKQEYLDRGLERIRWSLGKLVEKNQIRQAEAAAALARIRATLDLREACKDADIAIEAVFEDAELKKKVFQELDSAAPEKTILASNTSALPITNMARATKRPQKVVGMHFFNPPMLMPLIEVIRADTTSDATLAAAVDLTKSLGKTPIVVRKDVPGFITTRVLGPYFEEAAWIHEQEGIPIETIDAAMRFRAGFPMGPFELRTRSAWTSCTI